MGRRAGRSTSAASGDEAEIAYAAPELIVVAERGAGLRVRARSDASGVSESVSSLAGRDVAPLATVLAEEGVVLEPLFGPSEERLIAATATLEFAGAPEPELARYYRAVAPEERLVEIATRLNAEDLVECAYVKPAAAPPVVLEDLHAVPPLAEEPPALTPDFSWSQMYLDAAPGGIDARFAWGVAGGKGAGVSVIDIEGDWRFSHEDLGQNQGGVIFSGTPDLRWRNHGTAVVGVIGGDENGFGVTGIAPAANVRAISHLDIGSSRAIREAVDRLQAGDILLIELQRSGPSVDFVPQPGRIGDICVEYWPDDFAAIRYAIARGVIVVEAAGNGFENLDDPLYGVRPSQPPNVFPADWRNPFRGGAADSGAIVVGAGAPPPGTHGRSHGPDRSRLDFSNHGARVDVQGWGQEVTSAGYGHLQGGESEEFWYTDRFNGTSSASPIVVGALAALQGILRARGSAPLTPAQARTLLRTTGTPQQDAPERPASQRIGNRPDLRQMIAAITGDDPPDREVVDAAVRTGTQFRGMVAAGQVRRWFTTGWPADRHVIWRVTPLTPSAGAPQIEWRVQVERSFDRSLTYWISVSNVGTGAVEVEGRYAVIG